MDIAVEIFRWVLGFVVVSAFLYFLPFEVAAIIGFLMTLVAWKTGDVGSVLFDLAILGVVSFLQPFKPLVLAWLAVAAEIIEEVLEDEYR